MSCSHERLAHRGDWQFLAWREESCVRSRAIAGLLIAMSVVVPATRPAGAIVSPYAHPFAARADGVVYAAGTRFDAPAARLAAPVVGIAMHRSAYVEFYGGPAQAPANQAYWLAAADGGVFAQNGAPFLGSVAGMKLNAPVVGIASTTASDGYWLVASDGGIFTFGDARFYGSTGNLRLVKPIIGMAATPSGRGYWLVAADGGVFTFGDARFHGSAASLRLAAPIVAITPTTTGDGYWLLGRDGGVFTFGDAHFDEAATGSSSSAIALSAAGCNGYAVLRSDASAVGAGACTSGSDSLKPGVPFVSATFRLAYSS